jgi:cytochrome b561
VSGVAPSRRALTWWFGLMILGGFAFGLTAERRPFGDDILAYPLVVFFGGVGAALLLLRVVLQRPVPQLLPERVLMFGCAAGLVGFLAGNWLDVNLLAHFR